MCEVTWPAWPGAIVSVADGRDDLDRVLVGGRVVRRGHGDGHSRGAAGLDGRGGRLGAAGQLGVDRPAGGALAGRGVRQVLVLLVRDGEVESERLAGRAP